MNIIFMRHGEATDNVREIISDREVYNSVLTEKGKDEVCESIENLPKNLVKIYVSPLPRTIETVSLVREKYPNVETEITQEIREIDHGKYSGQKNNADLDETRKKQVAGDYFVRFGQYGENKFGIESRLCTFLARIRAENFANSTVLVVSHGSITSFMKRILVLKTPHIKTGKIEIFNNIDFAKLDEFSRNLRCVKRKEIGRRTELLRDINVNDALAKNLAKIAKSEFNDMEFPCDIFAKYLSGIKTESLKLREKSQFVDGVTLICFYQDFANLAKKFMEHYVTLGVENFVMIDNESTDKSREVLGNFRKKVNIDFWEVREKYSPEKCCGWRQRIMEHYGQNRWYLNVDADELFVLKSHENLPDFLRKPAKTREKYVKSLILDVYAKGAILAAKNLDDFCFVDRDTYKISRNKTYGARFYGGPRERVFGIRPSLQKVSLIFYTGAEVCANDHFYYPLSINHRAKFDAYLLHYKFLPGDFARYEAFAKNGKHWNDSREYKKYIEVLHKNPEISFYNNNISVAVKNSLQNHESQEHPTSEFISA